MTKLNISKSTQFRQLLTSPELSFIMEAHNALSAKIIEDAGFKGIWGSGLSISAALGVRDSNEASWTQVLDVLEFMSDATSIPILLDGDTGYGNFNNMRRLVKKLCQRDVAAVCIEDKLFPKTNSFIGEAQPLADVDEFCGKIMAGKDSQTDNDFSVIARVEALIAGWGVDEAIRRAEKYHEAGADGILIHSKRSTPDEILSFMKEWGNRAPVIIVPTMYYATPTEVFRDAGVSIVIWANHNLRAAITAMKDVCKKIYHDQSLINIEGEISSVKDIFEITGTTELLEAEERYLASKEQCKGVILAAARGAGLEDITNEVPKAMLDIHGVPLLQRLVNSMNESGISDIVVVTGYKHESVNIKSITTIQNEKYNESGEVASLACAKDFFDGECVISFGDILFRKYILDQLLDSQGDIVLAVDGMIDDAKEFRMVDLVKCTLPFERNYFNNKPVYLESAGNGNDITTANGRWIGLAKFSSQGSKLVNDEMNEMDKDSSLMNASMVDLFGRLLRKGIKIHVVYIDGHWLDVNDTNDLLIAQSFK